MSNLETISGATSSLRNLYSAGRIELPAIGLDRYADDLRTVFADVYTCETPEDVRWELGEVAHMELLWRLLARHMRGEHVSGAQLIDLRLSVTGHGYFVRAQGYQAMVSYLNRMGGAETSAGLPEEEDVIERCRQMLAYHPDLHPEFTIALREFYIGFAASLALVHADRLEPTSPTWMRDEFARLYAIGSYSVFRLLSGLMGDEMPEMLVPVEDRLPSIHKMNTDADAFLRWSDEKANDAAKSGEPQVGTFVAT